MKALPATVAPLRIPDGWTLESHQARDVLILHAQAIGFVTICFKQRGFRVGISASGSFVGDKWTRSGYERKAYAGRGWRQALVDDAVAHLF